MTSMVNKAEQLIQALSLIQPRVQQKTTEPVLDMASVLKQSIAKNGLLSVLIQDSQPMSNKAFRAAMMVLPSPAATPELPAGSILSATLDKPLPKGAVLIVKAEKGQLVIQPPVDNASKVEQLRVAIRYLSNQLTNQAPNKTELLQQLNQVLQQLPANSRNTLIKLLSQQTPATGAPNRAQNTVTAVNAAIISEASKTSNKAPIDIKQPLTPTLSTQRQQVQLLQGFSRATMPTTLPDKPLSQFAQVLLQLQQGLSGSSESPNKVNLLPQLLANLPKDLASSLQQKASQMLGNQTPSTGAPLINTGDGPEQRLPQLLNSLLQHQTISQLQHSALNLQTESPASLQWLPFFQQGLIKSAEYELESDATAERTERQWRLKVYFSFPPLATICAELRFTAKALNLTLWSESPSTLQRLQQHSESLQAMISNHVTCQSLHCQYGMPPKKTKPDNSQQQVDIRA